MKKSKTTERALRKTPFYKGPIPPVIAMAVCLIFSFWFIDNYVYYWSDPEDTYLISLFTPHASVTESKPPLYAVGPVPLRLHLTPVVNQPYH
jgi:hypothetical protein